MMKRGLILSSAAAALALWCLPAAASAAALVDDPEVRDGMPPSARAYFSQKEAEYQRWATAREGKGVSASAVDAPYRVLGTTSHKQLRNDFCVPATTETIDHYLRGADRHWSQYQWAAYTYNGVPLWTDAAGGNMWVMAMGLKQKTATAYAYSSGNTLSSVYSRTLYAIKDKGRPAAYGVRIRASAWPNYRIDHAGHIMCGRGFDWRYGVIYIDDPYPENASPPLGYGSAGGDTYGKKTYPKEVVAGGVVASASQQVVY